jgi:hypothetical protein
VAFAFDQLPIVARHSRHLPISSAIVAARRALVDLFPGVPDAGKARDALT